MKKLVSLFALTLLTSAYSSAALGPATMAPIKVSPIDRRIDQDVDVKDWRILEIFEYLLRDRGLRGGFVEMADCVDLPKGHLQIGRGLTIRQAMDALVAANPSYKWELKDGVVNLTPLDIPPLLDTRIAKFEKNATDKDFPAAIQEMLRVPEMKKRESELGIEEGPGQGGLTGGRTNAVPQAPIAIKIDIKNLTLRDALNKIIRDAPKGLWFYRQSQCGGTRSFIVYVQSDF